MSSQHATARRTPRRYKITAEFVDSLTKNGLWQEFHDQDCPGLILRISPAGKGSWYYRYKDPGGKRPRLFIGHATEMTPTRARQLATKASRTVDRAQDTPVERQQRKQLRTAITNEISPLTVREFLNDDYLKDLKTRTNWWYKKVHNIESQFGALLDQRLGEFDRESVLKTWVQEKKGKILDSTIEHYLAELSSVFKDAVEKKLIPVNPIAGRKHYIDPADHVRYLDDDEELAILTALKNREEKRRVQRDSQNARLIAQHKTPLPDLRAVPFTDHVLPMFLIARDTGLRLHELASQVWRNIDLVGRVIYVKTKDAKTRVPRTVSLSDLAVEVFTKWKPQSRAAQAGANQTAKTIRPRRNGTERRLDEDWVFASPKYPRTHIISPRTAFQRIVRQAGITKFVWRELRHDFGSHLAMEDVSIYAIQDAMGHANIRMTSRYAHLSPSYRLNTVGALDRRRSRLSEATKPPDQEPRK